MNKEEWLKNGYVTEPVDKALDLKVEIALHWHIGQPRRMPISL